ncbi:MAG: hypothetical protein MZV63_19890 [Marinilabiliales bacterium]|nr:hypothetical protein [Marinilabiliales bacterium]
MSPPDRTRPSRAPTAARGAGGTSARAPAGCAARPTAACSWGSPSPSRRPARARSARPGSWPPTCRW